MSGTIGVLGGTSPSTSPTTRRRSISAIASVLPCASTLSAASPTSASPERPCADRSECVGEPDRFDDRGG